MSQPEFDAHTPTSTPPADTLPRQYSRRTVAAIAASSAVLVLAVAAAGAVIGHAVWTSPSTSQSANAVIPGGSDRTGFGDGGSSAKAGAGAPSDVNAITAKVDPAIVDINSTIGYEGASGAGTGIVVSSNGEVLTNNHVVEGSTNLTATDIGNGKTYTATVVGYDPSQDVAVIQLQGASGLRTATIGDSSQVTVGQSIVGVGNAGGVGGVPAPAAGSITALNQSITASDELASSSEQLSGLIQVDAPIQSGDSGGPLVDKNGQVIGIDTAGSTNFSFGFGSGFGNTSDQGYAIPINEAAQIAKQILAKQGSSIVHVGATAFLGVQLANTGGAGGYGLGSGTGGSYGGDGASAAGVLIGGVVSGKPAQKAGLGQGDTITSLAGKTVDSTTALGNVMLVHHPGDRVELGWTDASGQTHTTNIQLSSGPPA